MSTASTARFRRARLLLGAWLAALLAACGPGTGGTGTGDIVSPLAGAQPAPLCSSSLAPALDCPGDVAIAAAGSARVAYTDEAGNLLLVIEGNSARLWQGCPAIAYDGRFSRLRDGSLWFVGEATTADAGPMPQLAGLQAQPLTRGAGIEGLDVELVGADDRLLLAPRTLRRSADAPAPPPCR